MPYWRLSAFYFCFFATLGVFLPYWTLYLGSLAFSPAEIGELMAVGMLTKVLAPNVWGWIADRAGRRMPIVRLASLASLCAFAMVLVRHDYWWLASIIFLFSFFWNATLPQLEATTLTHLGTAPQRYSRVRVWGSIGFILAASGLAPVFDRFGVGWVPGALLLCLGGIWVATLFAPEAPALTNPARRVSLGEVIRRREVLSLLGVCFLMQASHGPYYSFFSLFLEGHGYSRSMIGQLWAVGVIAETGTFLLMHRLIPRIGLRRLLLLSLGAAALRWTAVPLFIDSSVVLVVSQTLHAATFGVYHAAAIQLIHNYFSGSLQGRGQALYSSLSFGAGGAVGSLYAGYIWEAGGPATAFFIAAGVSLAAFVVTWRWVGIEKPNP